MNDGLAVSNGFQMGFFPKRAGSDERTALQQE